MSDAKSADDNVSDDSERDRAFFREFVSPGAESRAAQLVRKHQLKAALLTNEPFRIDRYEVREELGRGATGVVFRAYDPYFAIDVALKLLDEEPTSTSPHRLHREALALTAVHGRNIVRIYNCGLFEGQPWIAMEYIAGVTLETWIEGSSSLSWKDIVARFVESARGLAELHSSGFIHRDFKPRNVLISKESERVCVADLGLAMQPTIPGLRESGHPSEQQQIVGTRRYMSPEQISGKALTPASDQFSFCLSLYWALYGFMPVEGSETTAEHLTLKVKSGQRPTLPRQSPVRVGRVPAWLEQTLLRGLSYSPADRFNSMDEMIQNLTRGRGLGCYVTPSLLYVLAGFLAGFLIGKWS